MSSQYHGSPDKGEGCEVCWRIPMLLQRLSACWNRRVWWQMFRTLNKSYRIHRVLQLSQSVGHDADNPFSSVSSILSSVIWNINYVFKLWFLQRLLLLSLRPAYPAFRVLPNISISQHLCNRHSLLAPKSTRTLIITSRMNMSYTLYQPCRRKLAGFSRQCKFWTMTLISLVSLTGLSTNKML